MNVYVIAEGEKATGKVYRKWIPLVNAQLQNISYPHEFYKNNFLIYSGLGQPEFWGRVSSAVEDVNNNRNIDRLVVAFDSEDMGYEDKLGEAKDYINNLNCKAEVKFIVQHFCMETWFLGNKDVFRKKTQDPDLRDYYLKFNIRDEDPEDLPAYRNKSMNRAQFAYRYLRAGINDTHGNVKCYNKSNPGIVLEEQYFNKVKQRHLNFDHIKGFKGFLDAFV